MYTRYAEAAGLKIEPMESSPSELGGLKEMIFKSQVRQCSGSCATRAACTRATRAGHRGAGADSHFYRDSRRAPEAEEVDFELKPDEIRVEVCRAGGPGGQA
jgi:peptide chain release factor 1